MVRTDVFKTGAKSMAASGDSPLRLMETGRCGYCEAKPEILNSKQYQMRTVKSEILNPKPVLSEVEWIRNNVECSKLKCSKRIETGYVRF